MLLYQKERWWALINPISIAGHLLQHRALLWQFTKRNIEMQHKGSLFGLAWSVLSPLLLFAVYAFVFIAVFDNRFGVIPGETRADYAIGLFLGLALLQLFQEVLTATPQLVVQNPNYVKKVVFPLEILPASAFCAALFRCLVSLVLVLIAAVAFGPGLKPVAFWLLIIVPMLMLLSLGMAWALAAVGVFFRDLGPLMQFGAVVLTFMSGVFYSLDRIPHSFGWLRFNPLLILIDSGRSVVLWNIQPSLHDLAYVAIFSLCVCLLGHAVFRALKPAFADVV